MTTSSDVAALDCVYKLQEYAGIARRKRAVNKITWPGRKQVWRRYGADGRMAGDILSLETDKQGGEPLLKLVMHGGKRVQPAPSLDDIRSHAKRELEGLPEPLRRLDPDARLSGRDRRRVEVSGGGSRPPHWVADLSRFGPNRASQQQNSGNCHCHSDLRRRNRRCVQRTKIINSGKKTAEITKL